MAVLSSPVELSSGPRIGDAKLLGAKSTTNITALAALSVTYVIKLFLFVDLPRSPPKLKFLSRGSNEARTENLLSEWATGVFMGTAERIIINSEYCR